MLIKALCNQGGKKRLATILIMITLNVLLTTFLVIGYARSSTEALSGTQEAVQSPTVKIATQPDVPLSITFQSVDASNPLSPQINYVVQNLSRKPVRAYTVLEETATNSARSKGSTIINITSAEKILLPSQLEQGTFIGHRFSEPLLTLTLSIDFVEFADGTTWGKDTQQSAENLAGQRAGGRETIIKLRELVLTKGDVGIARLVKGEDVEVVTPPADRSEVWRYGFQTGHNVVLRRLRVAHEKGGSQQLATELRKQFDASEGRP